ALPRQRSRKRDAGMIRDEALERVLERGPPRRVVRRIRLRSVDEVDAAALHLLDEGIDDAGRIHRIAAAVDDEQRLVAQVVGKEIAVGVSRLVLEYLDEPVERQNARERRRVAHRQVVGPRRAVGYAGQRDAVLVDVIGPLHGVENRAQVLDLAAAPPRRLPPRGGHHVDLLDSRKPAVRSGAGRAGLDPADAAVQLHAYLVPARRVVAFRDVQRVEVLAGVAAITLLHDAARDVAPVDAPLTEAPECLVEPDAAGDDWSDGAARIPGRARAKKVREGGVDRRRRRLRRNQRGAARQRERQPEPDSATASPDGAHQTSPYRWERSASRR